MSFEPQSVDPSGLERRTKQVAAHYSRQGPSIHIFRAPQTPPNRCCPRRQVKQMTGRRETIGGIVDTAPLLAGPQSLQLTLYIVVLGEAREGADMALSDRYPHTAFRLATAGPG